MIKVHRPISVELCVVSLPFPSSLQCRPRRDLLSRKEMLPAVDMYVAASIFFQSLIGLIAMSRVAGAAAFRGYTDALPAFGLV